MLTITFNPSIDRRYNVNDFEKGKIFRTDNYQYTAGGKGLNVAKVIKSFNEDVMVTGFLGGNGGLFISNELKSMDIENKFIEIENETRSCLAIISNNGSQTEILERGPSISENEMLEFYKLYEELLDRVDIVCASGSLPHGLPSDIYKDIINTAKKKGKKFILDTSGQALKLGIEAAPYLIKPNREELEALTGNKITYEEELIQPAKYLLNKGVEVVIVSLGHCGAMAFYNGYAYRVSIPIVEAVNPVGSGDSMIAGFAVALQKDYDFETMLKVGAACGTANAMESETGKVDQEKMNNILKQITIEKYRI